MEESSVNPIKPVPQSASPLNPEVDFSRIFGKPQESIVAPTYLPASKIPLNKGVPEQFIGQLVSLGPDREYSTQQLQWLAADQQSWYGNIGRFAANTAITAVSSVLKTPGDIYAAATNDYNNAWLRGLNAAEEAIRPTGYLSEAATTGSMLDKLGSGSYWANTLSDAFGTGLAFLAPGAALKLANVGGRLANGLSKTAGLIAEATGGSEAGMATANAVKTALTSVKDLKTANKLTQRILGSEISAVGVINNAAALTTNTALEAMASGTEAYYSTKENLLASQPELGEAEIERRATLAAKTITAGNVPILMLSNLVFGRLMFDKLGSTSYSAKQLVKAVDDESLQAALKQNWGKALNPVKAVTNLITNKSADGWLTQRILGGFMSEGFLEEFQQSALERQVQDLVAANKLTSEMDSPLEALQQTLSGEFFNYINKYGGYNPAKLLTADSQQMESFILGGLVGMGFTTGRAVLGKEISAINAPLFGTAAKQQSRLAKTFGAKDVTQTEGLFSVIKKIQNRKYFDITPEQYKEAFLNDKGKFDIEKAQQTLMESADSKMRYAAQKALMLQNRAIKLKEAPDDVTRAILEEQFVADDLLDHFGQLLTHEHGYELFAKVVDDSIKSQAEQIKEYTGEEVSVGNSQQYADSLKRIAKTAHKAARQAFLDHDNRTELVAPGYLPQELRTGGTKADRMMYRNGLMQMRISTAVKTAVLGEQIKNLNEAVESATNKSTDIDNALKLLEEQQKDLLASKEELSKVQKELKKTDLEGSKKFTSINKYRLEQKILGIDVTDEQAIEDLKARREELKQQEAVLKEIVEAEANKTTLAEINKQRKLKEDTDKVTKYLTKKSTELSTILNGTDGFTPAEFNKTNNYIAAYTGKAFNGLQDLQNKLWDDYFIEEDYKNYLKNTQATRDAAEKQRILDKIESNKLANIFNNLSEVSVVTRRVPILDKDGNETDKYEEKAKNFYFSAPITVEVLNANRSGKTTEVNGKDLTGSFRIVQHVATDNAADEALILRSDVDPRVFVKIKADGTLELYPVGLQNFSYTYKEFEYSMSAPGVPNLNVTSEITDTQKNIIAQALDEHKDKVSKDAFKIAIEQLNRRYNSGGVRDPETIYQATPIQRLNALTYAMNRVSTAIEKSTALNVEGIRQKLIETAIQTNNLEKLLADLKTEYNDLLEAAADDIKFLEEFNSVDIATGYSRFFDYIEKYKAYAQEIADNQTKLTELKGKLDNLTTVLMQNEDIREIVTRLGIKFPYQSDIKAMTEVLNKFSTIADDDVALQELLDSPDIANSNFIKNLKAAYTKDSTIDYIEVRAFLNNVDGDLRKFLEAVKSQSKDRGFATYAFNEAKTFASVLSANLKEFKKTNRIFQTLMESDLEGIENYLKYNFAIEEINLSTSKKVYNKPNPYKIPNAVEQADAVTWTPLFNSEYGLLRTGGSEFQPGEAQADTFYGKYKTLINRILVEQAKFLEDEIRASSDPVLTASLQAQLDAVNQKLSATPSEWTKIMMDFDIDEVKTFVSNLPEISIADLDFKQTALATISQFYYYAWSKGFNPELNPNTGIALVTIHNVDQLPESLRDKVFFYEPETGLMYNKKTLMAIGINPDTITDVKAVVINNVKNPKDIDYTNEATYHLDPKLDNELIYASVRDYSNATVDSIKEDFDTSAELAKIKSGIASQDKAIRDAVAQTRLDEIIQEALDAHSQMRLDLLTAADRNLITTVKGFSFKSPGYLREGVTQEVEVSELFAENELFQAKNIEIPHRVSSTQKDAKETNAGLAKKYGNKKVGYWYVKANGTSTLIRPRTLAQTNEVNKFVQLIAYAADPKNDATSKKAVIDFLHNALYVRREKSKGEPTYPDYFAFKFSSDAGTIINLQIGNSKFTGSDLSKPEVQNELRRHLSSLYHNFKTLLMNADNVNKTFTSYEIDENGKLKSIKHDNYLAYLFKNSNPALNKGFAKSNKLNDKGTPIKPTKLVFNSARQDIYFYLADPAKLTEVKINTATTEQPASLADMKLPKDDSSYATVDNKTLTIVTYTYKPAEVVLAAFDANNDEAFAEYIMSGKLSQMYDKEVTVDGKKEFDQADFNFLENRSKFKVVRGNNAGHYFQLLSLTKDSVIFRYYTPTSVENKMVPLKEFETLINAAEQLGELSIDDLNIINTLDKQFEDAIDARKAAADAPTPTNTAFKVGDTITFVDANNQQVVAEIQEIAGNNARLKGSGTIIDLDSATKELNEELTTLSAPQPTSQSPAPSTRINLTPEDITNWSTVTTDELVNMLNNVFDEVSAQQLTEQMLIFVVGGETVETAVAYVLDDQVGDLNNAPEFIKLIEKKLTQIKNGEQPPVKDDPIC